MRAQKVSSASCKGGCERVVKGMVVNVRAQDRMIPWYRDWWDWLGWVRIGLAWEV